MRNIIDMNETTKTSRGNAYAGGYGINIQEARPFSEWSGAGTPNRASWVTRSMRQQELSEFSSAGIVCPTCGKDDFNSQRGMRIHHTATHGESIAYVTSTCEECGEDYTRRSHFAEVSKYCSRECANENVGLAGEDNPNYKEKVTLTCEWCGSEYEKNPSAAKISRFCSRSCLGKHTQENREYPDRVTLTCKQCGSEYEKPPSEALKSTFCCAGCQHEWRSKNRRGPNHPQWTGGVTIHRSVTHQLPRPWGSTRRDFLENHDGGCELCECEIPIRKNVHHIIPVLSGGVNAPELLMLLCPSCHQIVESYTKGFTERHLVEHLPDRGGI